MNQWHPGSLVIVLAVRILSEQGLSHRGSGRVLQEPQPSLKGVVNVDLAVSANDDHSAGTVEIVSFRIPALEPGGGDHVHSVSEGLVLLKLYRDVLAELLLELLGSLLDGLLDDVIVLLARADLELGLVESVQTLKHETLEHLLVLALVLGTLGELLLGILEYAVEQLLAGAEDPEPRLVGDGGAGDLLGHGGLLELLLVLDVDGVGLLADELGLFDLELLVGLDLDLAGLLHGLLLDEGRHLAELIVDLGG